VTACANRLPVRMTDADEAVVSVVEDTLVNPAVVARALAMAEAEIRTDETARKRDALSAKLATTDAEVARLTTAIQRGGGDLDPLLDAIRESEGQRTDLRQRIALVDSAPRSPKLSTRSEEAARFNHAGRTVLQRILRGRLTFTPRLNPVSDQPDGYDFSGPTRFDKLFTGIAVETPQWVKRITQARPAPRTSARRTRSTGTTADGSTGRTKRA
jgi:hypothetical protein